MDLQEQIDDLDFRVLRLKVEYEQYFMRILKREPELKREQIDKIIRRIGNEHISNTALKFRYRQIADKYNSFKQYWLRTLKEIESGTYRRAAEASGIQVEAQAPRSSAAIELEDPTVKKPSRAAAGDKNLIDYEEAYMKKLYKTYIGTKEKNKESTKGIEYKDLAKAVKQQRALAEKKYGTDRLDFKVSSKGGKTRIMVIPKKKKP